MDILTITSKLESATSDRSVENTSGFAGFRDADVCVWRGINSVKINDDDAVTGVWKVFLLDDLEGVWYLVVLRVISSKVVSSVVAVSGISSLVFS